MGRKPASIGEDRLSDLTGLKQNPGNLRARKYVPEGLGAGAPLVVILHGCTQDAASFDIGSGWSRLADRHGFALLFPEQKRENNSNLCFNWFTAGDTQRGMGEAASIQAMIAAMRAAHQVDPQRIFVTGLSAGGAMASVMLATYPESFAAGAIIAGVAYGCASGVMQAFDCMGGRAREEAAELGARIRRASPHKGPWPRVSVWQGSADAVVVPSNADAIVLQWTHVHGLPPRPDRTETVEGHPRRVWDGPDGTVAIEEYLITGMAHGTPLDPGTGAGESGEAGAHMLDVGFSSTDRIAAFFGIAPPPPAKAEAKAGAKAKAGGRKPASRTAPAPRDGPQAVIDKALRAAGLLR
ncbi:extracellular catalytic domain type 1 short-chain-length polyhydroxyalkanoate depolymerase [Sphingosinicella rhizophila]|uniref:PHB depolymerase family esterase n=1 Tax=Sphingosinicella rhizophila TaxID=3050082 RepID=A0ABU3Q780_9SPHN|nr:PHB depolymerase family esterase [Sphingosinicella sp. GR2756]MDT9599249.1 PHB depolymerase family esterase [Sphingosinicella sp. GR2756]